MKGYLRNDGRKGLRNLVLVAYLVECAHFVAQQAALRFAGQPVHLIGFGGCAPNDYAERVMSRLCTHPNVGGVVLVSLGCENFQRDRLLQTIRQSGREAELVVIQSEGGTAPAIARAAEAVSRMLGALERQQPVGMSLADLTIGTVCGGSDATSGFTANPAVGRAFDRLVGLGARCIFEEPGELIGCEHLMRHRGATPEVGQALYDCVRKADHYYKLMGHDSFSAGNAEGGLSTIEEKSLGSYSKSGSRPISSLIHPADVPREPGLYFMDVVPDGEVRWGFPNVNDNAEIVEMISCGCQAILYTTGRGSVAGSAIAPVVKVCGNPVTCARMADDIDVDASRIITAGASLDDIGGEIVGLLEGLAEGRQTKSEALGHREFHLGYKYFNPSYFCKHQ